MALAGKLNERRKQSQLEENYVYECANYNHNELLLLLHSCHPNRNEH